jgi:hypothetical protein
MKKCHIFSIGFFLKFDIIEIELSPNNKAEERRVGGTS